MNRFSILVTMVAVNLVLLITLVALQFLPSSSGAASADWEYRLMTPAQMDKIGIEVVAAEEGIAKGEDGNYQFPSDVVKEKLNKPNVLGIALSELKEDGFELISVTSDHVYIFKGPAS